MFKKGRQVLLFSSLLLILVFSSLAFADQFLYKGGSLSIDSSDFTLAEVVDHIGLASGKTITITGDTLPSQKLNIRLQGKSLDRGLQEAFVSSGVSNFSIGYDGDKPENSNTIKIFLTKKFEPSTHTTVSGYLNEKLGSHVNLLWEPDAVSLFEEAIKPVPSNIKPWVLQVLMSDIETETDNIHAHKITKKIVADILKKHTPQKDQNYLNQQINPLLSK